MLRYYNELLYFAQKQVGDKEKAKDIIQETYSKVLEIKDKYEISNERAYLYKIVKNIVIKEALENQKIESTEYEENSHISPTYEQPEEVLIIEDQEKIFMQILEELSPRAKQAFILFTIDGYSRKEIAEILNITSNAVEKLIKRATIKIEEELAKRGF
ncbi:RNA polymerase sigma factor [Arcobacter aquimarinus]|uniref:Sigma factor, ECF family n=1 Tax=Arcobacter aquimarinus TaxID=1315211 RepID=A0AAE7B138_9BACT|nr:sigma-70 family RNA polymerase sigma factor [Arcobacter aquimarinus]QKE25473.1 sigma factor, ECF family [Arcobacter aquimarinus]RXI35877.1 RNA polymerase subunit sigma [Arcobacter aquimarinus]